MKIYRPIKSNNKTQSFRENRVCSEIGVRPFNTIKKFGNTCPPGFENFYNVALLMKGHNGEDWATWYKEPVYFPVYAETKWRAYTHTDADGGKGVDVVSDNPILDGRRVKFRFWHLYNATTFDGQEVKIGDLIGYADSTGASTGNHLHWSMKFVNENGDTTDTNNGYYGAVDFSDWYENVFILDVLKIKTRAVGVISLAHKVILQAKVKMGLV